MNPENPTKHSRFWTQSTRKNYNSTTRPHAIEVQRRFERTCTGRSNARWCGSGNLVLLRIVSGTACTNYSARKRTQQQCSIQRMWEMTERGQEVWGRCGEHGSLGRLYEGVRGPGKLLRGALQQRIWAPRHWHLPIALPRNRISSRIPESGESLSASGGPLSRYKLVVCSGVTAAGVAGFIGAGQASSDI